MARNRRCVAARGIHPMEISSPNELYGNNVNINLATVIHQGFFLAPETGDYTFSFGQADDVVLLWLGQTAYSGWTRQNADVERTYLAAGGGQTQTTKTLQKGRYYPMRVAWADQGGGVGMSLTISAPDGTVLSSDDGGYFRTKACDGSYGDFPLYGSSSAVVA